MCKQSKDIVLNKISNHYVLRSVYKLSYELTAVCEYIIIQMLELSSQPLKTTEKERLAETGN